MLDYYSNFAPPSKEEAIKEIVDQLGEEKIVRRILSNMDLGSHTGWYVRVKPYILQKVKEIVKERIEEKNKVEYVVRHILGDATFTY